MHGIGFLAAQATTLLDGINGSLAHYAIPIALPFFVSRWLFAIKKRVMTTKQGEG